MGYTVYCKDEDLWSPSLSVGNYFLGSIQLLGNLIKVDSGVTSTLADSVEIDSVKLDIFVSKILEFIEKTNSTALLAMISGVTEILIALNAQINNAIPETTTKNRLLIKRSQKVFYPTSD